MQWSIFILCTALMHNNHNSVIILANGIPTAVKFGSAIIAAVEDDVENDDDLRNERMDSAAIQNSDENEQQQRENQLWEKQLEKLWQYVSSNGFGLVKVEDFLNELNEGRGKFHKRRKLLKYIYPLLIGILIAKTILIPLILKTLTALSTSSFVMSKIALLISGLLALKWIFAHNDINERTHLEVVHLPTPTVKSHQRPAAGVGGKFNFGWHNNKNANDWDDLNFSPSDYIGAIKTMKQPQSYIPISESEGVGTKNIYRPAQQHGNWKLRQNQQQQSYHTRPFQQFNPFEYETENFAKKTYF